MTPSGRALEGPLLSGHDAPGHRQRPADCQRRDHAGRRRSHASLRHRHHPCRDAAAQRVRRDLAVRHQQVVPARRRRQPRTSRPTPTSRATGAFSPTCGASTTSAPSSRCRTSSATSSARPTIHFAVSRNGKRIFTSQMLINGHPDNARDRLTSRILDPLAKETILVDFNPLPGSKIGELTAHFDIVLGQTVEELDGRDAGLGPRSSPDRARQRLIALPRADPGRESTMETSSACVGVHKGCRVCRGRSGRDGGLRGRGAGVGRRVRGWTTASCACRRPSGPWMPTTTARSRPARSTRRRHRSRRSTGTATAASRLTSCGPGAGVRSAVPGGPRPRRPRRSWRSTATGTARWTVVSCRRRCAAS